MIVIDYQALIRKERINMRGVIITLALLGPVSWADARTWKQPSFRHLSPERGICPTGFFPYEYDSCVMNSNDDMTWNDALAYCEARGASLLEVHSHHDQRKMKNYLTQHYINDIWLAGSDSDEEGVWKWHSGFPFNYNNAWANGEPSNGKDEDCIEIQNEKGHYWNDEPCYRWGRNEAFCKICSRTAVCPGNQMKEPNHCCRCKTAGMIRVPNTEICIRQSSYSKNGEPEYLYDGRSETSARTGIEMNPSIEFHLPQPMKISALAIELLKAVSTATCTRLHHMQVICNKKEAPCGYYEGTKRGEECNGKIRIVDIDINEPVEYIKLVISEPPKRCSASFPGDICVEDNIYLGDNMNVIEIAEITFD